MSPAARAKLDGAKLRDHLEPVVTALGYDLEELTATRAGSRQVLRVVVDADGGVTLDDIAEVSQAVSAALDEGGLTDESPYDLEVTSPGVSRPLTEPRHWRRNVGRLVTVSAGGTELTGRIVGADDAGVVLELPGKKPGMKGGQRSFGFAELGKGRVQVEFNRPGVADDEAQFDDGDDDGYEDADDGAEFDDADEAPDGDVDEDQDVEENEAG
jgi:ribosome maturation factor RimP